MFSDKPLVILEMANNHQGEAGHGLAIIDAFAEVVAPHRGTFDFAFKLQYRDLDSLIHPRHRSSTDNKHIGRFLSTRLDEQGFLALVERMRQRGFHPICTPFDEASVALVERHGFAALKIASCSLGDWPLMERIAAVRLPVIASTAGADFDQLDRVVAFLTFRLSRLALLHCVGEYPTPPDRQRLNQIDLLRARYPGTAIGLSSHESPDSTALVAMAIAKSASILEKHVGLPVPGKPLNAYSASPAQLAAWLAAAAAAVAACGPVGVRPPCDPAERDSLLSLRRGIFARRDLPAGHRLVLDDVFLAMPAATGQLTGQDLGKYVEHRLQAPVPALAPVMASNVRSHDSHRQVHEIVDQVEELVRSAHVAVPQGASIEISHHYGLERFKEVGCTIITVVNRAYCKKLIVLLPGQRHPTQYHKRKEETFHLLHGDLGLRLDDVDTPCRLGEVVTVESGVRHEFWTRQGAVLEEVSSTHYTDDSFYTDPAIAANAHRKTVLTGFFG
jgi:sialic acid synthase SpsE/mannose-6-phosphate isomerase-like protein (cupin superfamily)